MTEWRSSGVWGLTVYRCYCYRRRLWRVTAEEGQLVPAPPPGPWARRHDWCPAVALLSSTWLDTRFANRTNMGPYASTRAPPPLLSPHAAFLVHAPSPPILHPTPPHPRPLFSCVSVYISTPPPILSPKTTTDHRAWLTAHQGAGRQPNPHTPAPAASPDLPAACRTAASEPLLAIGPLPPQLPPLTPSQAVYKKLLGEPVGLADLQEASPTLGPTLLENNGRGREVVQWEAEACERIEAWVARRPRWVGLGRVDRGIASLFGGRCAGV